MEAISNQSKEGRGRSGEPNRRVKKKITKFIVLREKAANSTIGTRVHVQMKVTYKTAKERKENVVVIFR